MRDTILKQDNVSIEDISIREPSFDVAHGSFPSRYVITPIYGHEAIAFTDYRGKRVSEISPGAHVAISEAACVIDDSEFSDLVGNLVHDLEGLTARQGFVIEHIPSLSAQHDGVRVANTPFFESGIGAEAESLSPLLPQRGL